VKRTIIRIVFSVILCLALLPSISCFAAADDFTYAFSPDDGVVVTLVPSENVVTVSCTDAWFSQHDVNYCICALYDANGRMIGSTLVSNTDVPAEASIHYSGKPPVCRLYSLSNSFCPTDDAATCDLYFEAYCVENGTFSYMKEYAPLHLAFLEDYERAATELSQLEEQKTASEDAKTEAQLNLTNLPNKKDAYVSGRISYYMGKGYGSTSYSLANTDWSNYYSKMSATYQSTILTEQANINAYTTQISEKKAEIAKIESSFNSEADALSRKYPNACTNLCIGGTYETDHYSYDQALDMLTSEYNEELARLQSVVETLTKSKSDSEAAVLQAQLDLINLPLEKDAYIQSRVSYYMEVGVGGSQYALEHANKDWESYSTKKTSTYNVFSVK